MAAKTRRRILDVARRLFALHGYAATSVTRIAEEAGVATQTVYNRIGSKRDLLVGLQEVIEEAGEVSGIQRRIAESGDPREVVASVARLRRLMMEGAGDIVSFIHAAAASDADVGAAEPRSLALCTQRWSAPTPSLFHAQGLPPGANARIELRSRTRQSRRAPRCLRRRR